MDRHDGPMDIEIRTCTPEQFNAWLTTTHVAFGDEITPEQAERQAVTLEASRAHGAFEGGEIVGSAGAFTFQLTVPGGELGAAGVTMVGVLPSHRRRGILRRLMREQLDDIRLRGEPIAILFASEESIYQRFGYGLAANQARIEIEKDRAVFLNDPEPAGRMRIVSREEALKVFPSIYERVRSQRPGLFVRSQELWESMRLYDNPAWRRGAGPLFYAVLDVEGKAEGYALYRIKSDWSEGHAAGTLEVGEAMGTSPDTTREVWRFLFGVDLVERIRCTYLPSDWPIYLMLSDPRRLRFRFSDSLWLRVVDITAALEGRGYDADGRVVLGIEDPFCSWNEGHWSVEADGGRATVALTEESADLQMDVNALGAIYLGEFTFADLAHAGRVRGTAEALAKADRMFRTSVKPWSPMNF
jgi:predicted acetyltransferase